MTEGAPDEQSTEPHSGLHFRVGWIGLLVFVSAGTALEMLHAFKAGFYLDVGNETRRLMWTLAHAHGVGLSIVNVVYATTLKNLLHSGGASLGLASSCVLWSTVLMPLGFFLGGIGTYGGDPGVGVFLVPVGAILLWVGVFLVARAVWEKTRR